MKFSKFRRETATDESALPHQHQPLNAQRCEVCSGPSGDIRHTVWERQQLADRERAQQEIQRETGS